MTPLPATYSLWLLVVTVTYALAAQVVKKHYVSRHRTWL
jgi:hypothetical protein